MVHGLASAARTDVLTGLLNRRGFEEAFELELERARRGGHTLSVLVGDLDNFKQVNDRFGHHAGDLALARASYDPRAAQAPDRHRRAARRRGVRADRARRRRPRRLHAGRAPADGAAARRSRPSRCRSRSASASPAFPTTATPTRRCSGPPTTPSTPPRSSAATAPSSTAARSPGILTPLDRPDGPRNEHLATVLALAEALDMRDAATARHSQTVGRYAELIAAQLGLPPERRRARAARRHAARHRQDRRLEHAARASPSRSPTRSGSRCAGTPRSARSILANARLGDIGEWVLAHHERPDGDGFPFGIANGDIPLEATDPRGRRRLRGDDQRAPLPARDEPRARPRAELRRNAGTPVRPARRRGAAARARAAARERLGLEATVRSTLVHRAAKPLRYAGLSNPLFSCS